MDNKTSIDNDIDNNIDEEYLNFLKFSQAIEINQEEYEKYIDWMISSYEETIEKCNKLLEIAKDDIEKLEIENLKAVYEFEVSFYKNSKIPFPE